MSLQRTIKNAKHLLNFSPKILPTIQPLWKGSTNECTSQQNLPTTDNLKPRERNGNATNQNKDPHVKKFREVDDQFPVSTNENNPMLTLNCNLDKGSNKRIVGTISVTAFLIAIFALEAFQQAIVPSNVPSL